MKIQSIIFVLISLAHITLISGQDIEFQKTKNKHEIKTNSISLILDRLELNYDYLLLKSNTSIGFSIATINSNNKNRSLYHSISPRFRLNLGKIYGRGAYIESNLLFLYDRNEDKLLTEVQKPLGIGFGVAIGYKATRKRLVVEPHFGIGRIINDYDGHNSSQYLILGINVGVGF